MASDAVQELAHGRESAEWGTLSANVDPPRSPGDVNFDADPQRLAASQFAPLCGQLFDLSQAIDDYGSLFPGLSEAIKNRNIPRLAGRIADEQVVESLFDKKARFLRGVAHDSLHG